MIVGSVKTNIGHLESAAGIAGLIKVVLCLRNQQIPAHLHFHRWNPHIDLQGTPVVIPTEAMPWKRGSRPRLAGVSSFGFSGTNAHIILEEAPLPVQTQSQVERPQHLLALSARTASALSALTSRYAEHLRGSDAAIEDICFTANAGRSHFAYRAVWTGRTVQDLTAALADPRSIPTAVSDREPEVVFLFTGQGSQYPGMGRELYQTQPVFRAAIEECAQLLQDTLQQPLLDVLYGSQTHLLDETAYTQPALFAVEYALARMWQSWGVSRAPLPVIA